MTIPIAINIVVGFFTILGVLFTVWWTNKKAEKAKKKEIIEGVLIQTKANCTESQSVIFEKVNKIRTDITKATSELGYAKSSIQYMDTKIDKLNLNDSIHSTKLDFITEEIKHMRNGDKKIVAELVVEKISHKIEDIIDNKIKNLTTE